MRSFVLAAALVVLASPAIAANIEAGKYQVVLGDCEGCHGKDLAGGVVLETPFGKMVTPDIRMHADETRAVIKRTNAIAQISYFDPELNPISGRFNIYTSSFNNRGP